MISGSDAIKVEDRAAMLEAAKRSIGASRMIAISVVDGNRLIL
jgi:hypothetical protein